MHLTDIALDDRSPTPPPPPSPSRALARLYSLRQLRELCARHGLAVSGSKHELAARVAPSLDASGPQIGQ